MKRILHIFLRDLSRIGKNTMAWIILVIISVLPAAYAWFNLAACWNPYANTHGIQVAVASEDKGGGLSARNRWNAGDAVLESLSASQSFGWQFVDKEQAIEGVRNGRYYAALVLPEDFSEKLTGIMSPEAEHPKVEYYINEKKGSSIPRIAGQDSGIIRRQISLAFNEAVASALSGLLGSAAKERGEYPADFSLQLTDSLEDTSKKLEELETSLSSLHNVSDEADALIQSAGRRQEQARDQKDSSAPMDDIQPDIAASVEQILDSARDFAGQAYQEAQRAFSGENKEDVLLSLEAAKASCVQLSNVYQRTGKLLEDLDKSLPNSLYGSERVLALLEEGNRRQKNVQKEIDVAEEVLRSTGILEAVAQKKLTYILDEARGDANYIYRSYQQSLQQELGRVAQDVSDLIEPLVPAIAAANGGISELEEILEKLERTADGNEQARIQMEALLKNTREQLASFQVQVQNLTKEAETNYLLEIVEADPEAAGGFLAESVHVNEQILYPIQNYGSALAPGYSTAALWMGSLLLVLLLHVHVEETDRPEGTRLWHCFVGRYLLFVAAGLAQSTLLCLGELYFLKIQCENPFLFLLAGWASSLVYTSAAYTLAALFGKAGKAACLLLLAVQLAGASGIFPIEMTPSFFQNIYAAFPFAYGASAMRETIGGIYGEGYWNSLLQMLLYLPFILAAGIFLRYPLDKLRLFFKRRLEDTKLM